MEDKAKIFNLTQVGAKHLLKPVLSLPKLPTNERGSSSVMRRSSRVPSTEITVRQSHRSRASSSFRASKSSSSTTRLIKPTELLDEIKKEASITIDSLAHNPENLIAVMQRIERSLNVKDQIESIHRSVKQKRDECNRLSHARKVKSEQLKTLKESLSYMQKNVANEVSSDRVKTLEKDIEEIREQIAEEQQYSLTLKSMYRSRMDNFLQLRKPMNQIRSDLSLASFKEHELHQDLMSKSNSLKHVLRSAGVADNYYEEQQKTHTMKLSLQLDCLRERSLVKKFVDKLGEQENLRVKLQDYNFEMKKLYESVANAEDEEAITEELTQHQAYISRQERLLKKLQRTVHVSSAEDMLDKLEYLKENKLALEALSQKLVGDIQRAREELKALKSDHELITLGDHDSDAVSERALQARVNTRTTDLKSLIAKIQSSEKTVLSALGLIGKIYNQVNGEAHTTTSSTLVEDCEKISRMLVREP